MRDVIADKLEDGRIRRGELASRPGDRFGAFIIMGPKGERLTIMSSGADHEYGWEHVSVSTPRRTPNWGEMCFVKDLFWRDDETVIQFHPPRAEYVNYHRHCLHLWRPVRGELPLPPSILVGPKTEVPA
jgi:hypothetical protein